MKLVSKNAGIHTLKKLSVVKREKPCLDAEWHFHPEFELLYISKSFGIRFVGDSVSHFSPGDLVLVGSYLPHLWRNNGSYYKKNSNQKVKTVVTKFIRDFIGADTFKNPEFGDIDALLSDSRFGVSFGKSVSEKMHDELLQLCDLSPVEKSISLLTILHRLSREGDKELLSSSEMHQLTKQKSGRIDKVYKFISDNYNTIIKLDDVAKVANMTPNSFCRFFKKYTNKSFIEFLNEVRIRNASRLLIQEDLTVSQIAYTVGYNSITNFNKQFKLITGVTPLHYKSNFDNQE